jgi:hypothetical protein
VREQDRVCTGREVTRGTLKLGKKRKKEAKRQDEEEDEEK